MNDPLDSTREPRHEGACRLPLALLLRLASRSVLIRYSSFAIQSFANVVLSAIVSRKVTGNYSSTPFARLLSSIPIALILFIFHLRHGILSAMMIEIKSNVVKYISNCYFCFYDFDFSERIKLQVYLNNNNILKNARN